MSYYKLRKSNLTTITCLCCGGFGKGYILTGEYVYTTLCVDCMSLAEVTARMPNVVWENLPSGYAPNTSMWLPWEEIELCC